MDGREQVAQGQGQGAPVGGQGVVEDAQRRLLLVLRAQHGPQADVVWCGACSRAGVVSTGQLTADELDRVASAFAEGTGADAVAGRTCRVRLLFLRSGARPAATAARAAAAAAAPAAGAPAAAPRAVPDAPAPRSPLTAGTTRPAGVRGRSRPGEVYPAAAAPVRPLRDRDVQAAFAQPDALDEAAWLRRLAELERELA